MVILIGIAEIIMALWILSGYKNKLNTITQISVVIVMNVIEIILAPDLLLWGKANLLFAIIFVSVVYYNGFKLKNT